MKRFTKIFLISFFALSIFVAAHPKAVARTELLADLSELGPFLKDPGQLRLVSYLQDGLHTYDSVNDYKAVFRKREAEKGSLGATEVIYLKFEKPFKIFMKWLNADKKGLELVYERGKNKGKLVIHKPGVLFGLVPLVFLDQDSPWVRKGSASYDIEDAGIGTFLFDFTKAVIRAAKEEKLKVNLSENSADNPKKGRELEVTFLETKKDDDFFAYRILILFDEKNSLPVEMELYDWENKPIGFYAYKNLKLNVGEDEAFKKHINRHLLKVYQNAD